MDIEYKIITATDFNCFQQSVNAALADGWALVGGVGFTGSFLMQAVTKASAIV